MGKTCQKKNNNKFTHSAECFKCTIRVCRERHLKIKEKWTPLSRQRVAHSVANPKFNDKIYLKIVVCRLKPQQAETQAVHSKAHKMVKNQVRLGGFSSGEQEDQYLGVVLLFDLRVENIRLSSSEIVSELTA